MISAFARKCYREKYDEDLPAQLIFEMVTTNPRSALRLKNHGCLEPGAYADFFVLKGKYPHDPVASLQEADLEEIVLVVVNGEPVYGQEVLKDLFALWNDERGDHLEYFNLRGEPRIMRKPTMPAEEIETTPNLKSLMDKIGIENTLDFMPISALGKNAAHKSISTS